MGSIKSGARCVRNFDPVYVGLGSKNGSRGLAAGCLLHARKRTSSGCLGMSKKPLPELMHRSKHDGYSITSPACPRRHREQLFEDGLRVQNARKKR